VAIGLYVTNKSGEKELVFEMSYKDFDLFEAANDVLQQKTGIFVDPCGTTRISLPRTRNLFDAITSQLKEGSFQTRHRRELAQRAHERPWGDFLDV
jgi:hypothetical protein